MNTLLQTAALLAAACLAGAAVADPVAAEPGAPGGHGPDKVLVIVSSHGLDLSSEAGADQFIRRLDMAIIQACDDRPKSGAFALGRSAQFHACRAKALETAMAYVHSPIVKQRYADMRRSDELRLAHR
ncbi:UrcA family protein [Phenylobacterium sp.]|jgi:UrcA family protein|uniref:UrcA family protein n=1 Tax=Phenylobacterium sp. TaxID=1871053 RepID=UPI002E33E4B6|nr:UrcA family protein [Phenylobacterium sp.]HEX4712576.1 UrcA family protein [Phenylobacterium sp.]